MGRSQGCLLGAALVLMGGVSCKQEVREQEVTVRVLGMTDPSGVPVYLNDQKAGSTSASGVITAVMRVAEGHEIVARVELPEPFEPPQLEPKKITFAPSGTGQPPIVFDVQARRRQAEFDVHVIPRGRSGNLSVDGQPVLSFDGGEPEVSGRMTAGIGADIRFELKEKGLRVRTCQQALASSTTDLTWDLKKRPKSGCPVDGFESPPQPAPLETEDETPKPVTRTPRADRRERDKPARERVPRTQRTPREARPDEALGRKAPSQKVSVDVTCRPAGMQVWVDGEMALSACDGRGQVSVLPGLHRFELRSGSGDPCSFRRDGVEVPPGGRAPVVLETDCSAGNCFDGVKKKSESNAKLVAADMACLRSVKANEKDFILAQLLLGQALLTQGSPDQAESVLASVATSPRGRTQGEVHALLAQARFQRKRYGGALKAADDAWRYRTTLRGSSGRKRTITLNLLKIRARSLEKLFEQSVEEEADDRDILLQRALDAYRKLLSFSKTAKDKVSGDYAAQGIERLEAVR